MSQEKCIICGCESEELLGNKVKMCRSCWEKEFEEERVKLIEDTKAGEREYYNDACENWDGDEDDIDFADPGGRSALRAASRSNPRNRPCPTCGEENVLTPKDVQCGYQCDRCADRAEGIGYGGEY